MPAYLEKPMSCTKPDQEINRATSAVNFPTPHPKSVKVFSFNVLLIWSKSQIFWLGDQHVQQF